MVLLIKIIDMIKAGVLGAGHLGKIHLRLLEASEQFELIGFFDTNQKNTHTLVKEKGYTAFESEAELIKACDMVDIVTPTIYHHQNAINAINQGKHIFIEKPIANSVAEANEITFLARKRGVLGQVGHVERYNPAFKAIKDAVTQPKFIESHRLAEFNPRGTDVPVVLDLMIHDIDAILSVVQSKVIDVQASGVSIISETPDIANARLRFENGCVANLTANRVSLKKIRKSRFFLKNGYVEIDYLTQNLEIVKVKDIPKIKDDLSILVKNAEGEQKKIDIENPVIQKHNSIQKELEDFYNCILNSKKPRVSLEDGARALEVAKRIMNCI